MKTHETKKLFYGEYPYKLVWVHPTATCFRGGNLPNISKLIDTLECQKRKEGTMIYKKFFTYAKLGIHDLQDLKCLYSELSANKNFKIRTEMQYLCVYSLEKSWLYQLAHNLNFCIEWWEPTQNNLAPNTVLMKNMHEWEYKITLSNKDLPDTFINWVENNLNNIRIGNTLLHALRCGNQCLNGYHFYVKNERYLSIISLVLGSGIRRIDKVISTSDNA